MITGEQYDAAAKSIYETIKELFPDACEVSIEVTPFHVVFDVSEKHVGFTSKNHIEKEVQYGK